MERRKLTATRAILGRWSDLVLLSLTATAAAIALVLYMVRKLHCDRLTTLVATFWPELAVLAVVLLISFMRRNAGSLLGLRHFALYPPTWLAIIFSGAATCLVLLPSDSLRSYAGCGVAAIDENDRAVLVAISLIPFTILAIGFVTVVVQQLIRARRDAPAPSAAETTITTPDGLLAWILSDAPASSLSDDLFGRVPLARRLAALLVQDSVPTIALVGVVGSGKSTLLNFGTEQLRQNADVNAPIRVARVSVWPYATVEAAIRAILLAIVQEVSNEVDTSRLRDLPDDYLAAVEVVGDKWAKMARGAASKDPAIVLRSLEHVTVALGMRLVLWIEDFERFAGLSADGVAVPEHIRQAPLRALLNELATVQRIQVVLASAAPDFRFDVEKFARVVLVIPPLDAKLVWQLLLIVRALCLKRFEDIDPAQETRQSMWTAPDESRDPFLAALGVRTTGSAAAKLFDTPRQLKQALRYAWLAWNELHGEVDFDDVFVISLIRSAKPSVYALINDHIGYLRDGASKRDAPAAPLAFPTALSAAVNGDPRAEAVRHLLSIVFPGWLNGEPPDESKRRPQGFLARHTDYWVRYNSFDIGAQRDQPVLQAMRRWRQTRDLEFVELLSAPEAGKAEAFLRAIVSPEELLVLLEDVVINEVFRDRRDWTNLGHIPEGVPVVWRLMREKAMPAESLVRTLHDLVDRFLTINLAVVYSIVYLFAHSSEVGLVIPVDAAARLGGRFRHLFANVVTGRPRLLARMLEGTHPALLHWICWTIERARRADYAGLPMPEWAGLSKTIIAAAKLYPRVMIPPILLLITSRRDGVQMDPVTGTMRQIHSYSFARELADRLFGLDEMRSVWATAGSLSLDPDFAEMWDAVAPSLITTH
jgi:hypothetical protein